MKKFTQLILFIILTLTIVNCQKKNTYTTSETNGVNTIENNGIPANPNQDIKLEKIQEIKGFHEINNNVDDSFFYVSDYVISNTGDLFVYDFNNSYIYQFNKNGEFVSKFGGKGNGPGEISDNNVTIGITEDSFKIFYRGFWDNYSLNGTYLNRQEDNNILSSKKMFDLKDKLLFYGRSFDRRGEDLMNESYLVEKIYSIAKTLENYQEFPETIETVLNDLSKDVTEFYINEFAICSTDDTFFISSRSKTNYIINEYDINFNHLLSITMPYKQQEYSASTQEYIQTHQSDLGCIDDPSAPVRDNYKLIYDNKLAFNNLHYDNTNHYLLVENAPDYDDKSVKFDIFKDGIYQNSYTFKQPDSDYRPMPQNTVFRVNNGKLYYYSEEDNSIYIYKIIY